MKLASPLLSACRESRWYALQFYSLRLRIYEFPKVPIDRSACYFSRGGRQYESIANSGILLEAKWDTACRLGAITTDQKQAGTLYLNPRYDTFLHGPNFIDYFLHDTSGSADLGQHRPIVYVTAPMGEAAGYGVRNLVFAEAPSKTVRTTPGSRILYGKEVTAYSLEKAYEYWPKHYFTNAEGWLHCWIPRSNVPRKFPRILPRFLDSEDFFGYMGPTDGIEKLEIEHWKQGSTSLLSHRPGVIYDRGRYIRKYFGDRQPGHSF